MHSFVGKNGAKYELIKEIENTGISIMIIRSEKIKNKIQGEE